MNALLSSLFTIRKTYDSLHTRSLDRRQAANSWNLCSGSRTLNCPVLSHRTEYPYNKDQYSSLYPLHYRRFTMKDQYSSECPLQYGRFTIKINTLVSMDYGQQLLSIKTLHKQNVFTCMHSMMYCG